MPPCTVEIKQKKKQKRKRKERIERTIWVTKHERVLVRSEDRKREGGWIGKLPGVVKPISYCSSLQSFLDRAKREKRGEWGRRKKEKNINSTE